MNLDEDWNQDFTQQHWPKGIENWMNKHNYFHMDFLFV